MPHLHSVGFIMPHFDCVIKGLQRGYVIANSAAQIMFCAALL